MPKLKFEKRLSFIDGKKVHTLRGESLVNDFFVILDSYIEKRYAD